MQLRVLLAGLAGGVVMFVWGFVFWAVLPLPKMYLPAMPNEAAVRRALDATLPASGTYVFPSRTEENHESMKARYAEGPVGMIAFHKGGVDCAFHFAGWGLAGLAISGIVKPQAAAAAAA